MQAIILGCGSLLSHIEAAQAKMQTDFPVVELDRNITLTQGKCSRRF